MFVLICKHCLFFLSGIYPTSSTRLFLIIRMHWSAPWALEAHCCTMFSAVRATCELFARYFWGGKAEIDWWYGTGTLLLQCLITKLLLWDFTLQMQCYTRFLFIRKALFFLSLNFLNFSRNWDWDFLTIFLPFAGINWLKRVTLYL